MTKPEAKADLSLRWAHSQFAGFVMRLHILTVTENNIIRLVASLSVIH